MSPHRVSHVPTIQEQPQVAEVPDLSSAPQREIACPKCGLLCWDTELALMGQCGVCESPLAADAGQ